MDYLKYTYAAFYGAERQVTFRVAYRWQEARREARPSPASGRGVTRAGEAQTILKQPAA